MFPLQHLLYMSKYPSQFLVICHFDYCTTRLPVAALTLTYSMVNSTASTYLKNLIQVYNPSCPQHSTPPPNGVRWFWLHTAKHSLTLLHNGRMSCLNLYVQWRHSQYAHWPYTLYSPWTPHQRCCCEEWSATQSTPVHSRQTCDKKKGIIICSC